MRRQEKVFGTLSSFGALEECHLNLFHISPLHDAAAEARNQKCDAEFSSRVRSKARQQKKKKRKLHAVLSLISYHM